MHLRHHGRRAVARRRSALHSDPGAQELDGLPGREHTGDDFSDVRHLFSAAGKIYAIDRAGALSVVAFD